MPFKYTVQSPEKIVFTRLSEGCGRFMFISIGTLFTIIGICLILFGNNLEMPFLVLRFIVPLFGGVAVYIGIILPRIQSKTTPDEIIFDNANGRVQVNQQASDIKTAYIYYNEIEDFIVKAKKQESSSSSSTSNTIRSSYTYHVYLSKKDGGQWELLRRSTEVDALAEIVKLKTLIRLDTEPKKAEVSGHSEKYKITNDYHATKISWRNKLGYGPLFLGIFTAVFITFAYAILSSGFLEEDFPVFAYFVVGFIGLVFVIVIGGNVLKMIKNAKTVYAISITNASLDYIECDLAGRIQKTTQFPLTDLHAISFSFDTDNTMRKIFIYTHDQFLKQNSLKISFSIDAIKEIYNFYQQLVAVDMQDLTAVEALYMENYLQQQIRDRGNIQVA
jgi:hypothetical protein